MLLIGALFFGFYLSYRAADVFNREIEHKTSTVFREIKCTDSFNVKWTYTDNSQYKSPYDEQAIYVTNVSNNTSIRVCRSDLITDIYCSDTIITIQIAGKLNNALVAEHPNFKIIIDTGGQAGSTLLNRNR